MEPLIFEKSAPGRTGYSLPPMDVDEIAFKEAIPEEFLRKEPADLPELSEMDIIRHFMHLSALNHHVDKGFYPLGSCTMKYNPKINEDISRFYGFTGLHPMQPESTVQGALKIMAELGEFLCEITGMKAITLQPSAGAQGELTGIKMIRAFHEANGNPRKKIILPDSAHGTNPASATISGYTTVQIRSEKNGLVDINDLKSHINEDVAAFMLTNPNTLGLFEKDIKHISKIVHDAGALLYMDGANLNALLGIVRPGDLGFDLTHINLHKTFSTPHGGGGPGSGPVAVNDKLKSFLPVPTVVKSGKKYKFKHESIKSIGKIHGFWGHFNVMIKAYVYIRMLGADGLKKISENAILNANYIMRKLEKYYYLPHKQHHMHECVFSGDRQKEKGIKTLDIAKRLLDYGIHAPTVYFPLIVHEAIMIEPTETESKETLDTFIEAMIQISREVEECQDCLKDAPLHTPVGRLNEAMAARDLNIRYKGALDET